MAEFKDLENVDYKFSNEYGLTYITHYTFQHVLGIMSDLRHDKKINTSEYHTLRNIFKHYYDNSIKIKQLDEMQPRTVAQKFIGKRKIRLFIFSRDGNKCLKCKGADNLTIDHIVPVSKGGVNSLFNLQTLCKSCNSIKKATYKDYRHGGR